MRRARRNAAYEPRTRSGRGFGARVVAIARTRTELVEFDCGGRGLPAIIDRMPNFERVRQFFARDVRRILGARDDAVGERFVRP